MTMETREFLVEARLEAEALEAWIEAGWLIPDRDGGTRRFTDIDLARAQLIRDLKQDLGVNDESIPVILDLVDQLHGVRRTLHRLLSAICTQPEATRRRIVADGREATFERIGDEPSETQR
jgi:chaperone modulatory protein CbpM